MDLKDIKAIIDLMKKNSLSEFELEKQEFKIKLKRSGGAGPIYDEPQVVYNMTPQPAVVTPALAASSSGTATGLVSSGAEIKSPMIGTFYRAPSPESTNYIEVGSEVNAETVVCIIEAMKVMNEIKAEMRGVVTKCLVDNAKPVEFGQPLFEIRPL